MKKYGLVLASLMIAQTLSADTLAGPKGGKLLASEPQRAEFYVNAERKVEITFYDAELKPVNASGQAVTILAEAPAGKTKLGLEEKNGTLVSKEALPDGDGYNVVVQIRVTPETKPQNFRVPLHLETCGECQHAEYACACDHGAEEAHGHER